MNEYECPSMKKKKGRQYNITVKPKSLPVTSYGGTFPVSKEETPLPSPVKKSDRLQDPR